MYKDIPNLNPRTPEIQKPLFYPASDHLRSEKRCRWRSIMLSMPRLINSSTPVVLALTALRPQPCRQEQQRKVSGLFVSA